MVQRSRAGFTFVEILMVMLVIAILFGIAYPKITVLRERGVVLSAKQRVAATIAAARQASISRGVPVKFVVDGNTIASVASPYGTADTVQRGFDVEEAYGATLAGDEFELVYDPRGIAPSFVKGTIVVSYNAKADTLCVQKLGRVQMRGC